VLAVQPHVSESCMNNEILRQHCLKADDLHLCLGSYSLCGFVLSEASSQLHNVGAQASSDTCFHSFAEQVGFAIPKPN
jgi:hypothetical protein